VKVIKGKGGFFEIRLYLFIPSIPVAMLIRAGYPYLNYNTFIAILAGGSYF